MKPLRLQARPSLFICCNKIGNWIKTPDTFWGIGQLAAGGNKEAREERDSRREKRWILHAKTHLFYCQIEELYVNDELGSPWKLIHSHLSSADPVILP